MITAILYFVTDEIRMVDNNVPVTTVWASRGKVAGAEPGFAHRLHHAFHEGSHIRMLAVESLQQLEAVRRQFSVEIQPVPALDGGIHDSRFPFDGCVAQAKWAPRVSRETA